ncbi:hypothetical protein PC110_g21986 [Phytophthora cactorum]|uniref:Uncharacterized protein n=2 Tax=Phytophthora cactorum TaxID=29920 RepID=A0A329RAR1_9STRA|nr:hypothetical protein PC110_g21986 [Phytophthora cactorum]
MAAHRETRRERDAFMARLEGRSLGERQRLSMEHRAYMNGERDADGDFGPEESHLETATSAAGTTSLSSTTEPRPLARPPSPRPPLGKDACYLARKASEAMKKRAAPLRLDKPSGQQCNAGGSSHPLPDGAVLNSDVEGDIESDDWYTETEVNTTSDICSGGEDAVTQHAGKKEDVDCDPSEDNEGGTAGDALLLREKNRAKRQQLRERLAAAKAKLSRDWATTTKTGMP